MLANIQNAPTDDQSMNTWSFSHTDLVNATIANLNTKGKDIVPQIIDPIPLFDQGGYLRRLQTAHDSINSVLGLVGSDLTDVDISKPQQLQAWVNLVYNECFQWTLKTGVF